jgi:exodeoxyribonuclease VII large subunit
VSQIPLDLNLNITPERRVWSVSELATSLRSLMEAKFFDLWVEGEVSNFKLAQSGHMYFTLKDDKAQLRCVCFRDKARLFKFVPEDGLQVVLRGALSFYETRGDVQLYVSLIEPQGYGALQLAFEQLKKRLEAAGLFDSARKKALPVLPLRIGIITSPSGAAVRDILRVLKRRFPNLHILLYPVRVQGEGAAAEIVAALDWFNRAAQVDVLILARGGGSIEDLWAFNEEPVARAIASSRLPIITGIGHETDFTIADFVADLRAPTPSAAAELVVRQRAEFEQHLAAEERHLGQQVSLILLRLRGRIQSAERSPGFRRVESMLRSHRQRSDELTAQLSQSLRALLSAARHRSTAASSRLQAFDLRRRAESIRLRLNGLVAGLRSGLERAAARKRRRFAEARTRLAAFDLRARVGSRRRRFENASQLLASRIERALAAQRLHLDAASIKLQERGPFHLLERGYAIAYTSEGRVIRSIDQVETGEEITVRVARGALGAGVRSKKNIGT